MEARLVSCLRTGKAGAKRSVGTVLALGIAASRTPHPLALDDGSGCVDVADQSKQNNGRLSEEFEERDEWFRSGWPDSLPVSTRKPSLAARSFMHFGSPRSRAARATGVPGQVGLMFHC